MDTKIGALLGVNISLEGISKLVKFAELLDAIKPLLSGALILVQIIVGIVTVYYIWRKAKAVRVPED